MDKLDKNNKIKESFENHLSNELPPDLLWENFSKQLDNISTEETAEKVKESFEHGFEQELLPVLLWSDIAEKLDQQTVSEGYKIKESFEEVYKDEVPLDRWDELENQLEIETVWKKVNENLNQNTKKNYWREKAMQLSIAVLAIFWLRGCGVGEEFMKQFGTDSPQNTIVSTHSAPNDQDENELKISKTLNSNPSSKTEENSNNLSNGTLKDLFKDDLKTKKDDFLNFKNANASINGSSNGQNSSLKKQNSNKTKQNNAAISSKKGLNKNNGNSTEAKLQPQEDLDLASPLAKNDDEGQSIEKSIGNALVAEEEGTNSKEILETNTVATVGTGVLTNPITNPNQIQDFYIEKKSKKIKFEPHFELGAVGRIGTSVLLCGATDEAIKEKSMLKTQMRLSWAVGATFHAFFTRNDALVVGIYPYSSHQQYFGGYTRDGKFYNKEIKLTYYNFSIGYQRTLLNYNKKKAPSALYARAEYDFGYLHEYTELMDNTPLKATNNAYKKMNHSIGLAIGNTHRFRHFLLDYGIYANIGLSSVLDSHKEKALPVMETPQLMNMGGYIGCRYVF